MKNSFFFPNLDGLRTIACLMVFGWHALNIGHNSLGIETVWLRNLLYTFLNGQTGVSIFFVLSGFLITYIIISEINARGKFSLKNFYVRRVLRIWPLYYILLILLFILIPLAAKIGGTNLSASDAEPVNYFLFLSNFDVLRIFETNGIDFLPSTITWSVAIEEQFYLVWPLLFYWLSPKNFIYIFVVALSGGLVFRIINYDEPHQLYFHTLSAITDLAIGGTVAYCSINYGKFKLFFERLVSPARLLVYGAGLLLMFSISFVDEPVLRLLLKILQSGFFAFVILDQSFNTSSLLKLSKSKLLTRLGKYTYGMYMLHPLVLMMLNTILVRGFNVAVDIPWALFLKLVIGLPLTILLARVSYIYLEKRFLMMKDRFSYDFRKKTVEVAVVTETATR